MTEELEFFQSTIFERTVNIRLRAKTNDEVIVADLGLREAAELLAIGTFINYLSSNDASPLLSSPVMLQALINLNRHNIRDSELINIDGDHLRIEWAYNPDEEQFVLYSGLIKGTFETFLLLARENILHQASIYFVESIAWTDDAEWQARKSATGRRTGGVEEIVKGLSNVLSYLEETRAISGSVRERVRDGDVTLIQRTPSGGILDNLSEAANVDVFMFHMNRVMAPRLNLTDEIVDRYIVLAGQCLDIRQGETAEFLDGRRQIFERITSLIGFAGGNKINKDRRAVLWKLFTSSAAESMRTRFVQENSTELGTA